MKEKRLAVRLFCLILITLTLVSSVFSFSAVAAGEPTPPTPENCKAACLYDKTHNKMLVSTNADVPLNTSTSAKVMMGYLACEILADRLDEAVTITDKMLQGASGYSMSLKVGEEIKIIDLLYGAICASYNDAGYVLASICAGSAQGFVELMNERAKALSANSTSYTNPLGYPDNAAMVTTLSDTLKIALDASENELYMEISSAKSREIGATNMNGGRVIYNRNYLISSRSTQAYYNAVCHGMNAGISGEAGGWSIITLAKDDGAEYICIILGGTENEETGEIYAYNEANKLIKWACNTYNLYKIYEKGQVIGTANVYMTALGSEKIGYAVTDNVEIYIPDHSSPDITYRVDYDSDRITAPISAGERIGVVKIYSNGELVGECPVALVEDCEANGVMKVINVIGEYTKSRAFIATLIFFIVVLPIALILKSKRGGKRGKYRRY